MPHKHLNPLKTRDEAIVWFKQLLGNAHVLTAEDDLKIWGTDWTKVYTPNPLCILLPHTTAEISACLKYCNDNQIAVTPSGGRTGLCAAAVANQGEVVLSLQRMSRILSVDTIGLTITAEAGATTESLQIAAREAGLFFPVDLAAKGSCQLGGNIATNAGGVKLIRYGGTREQVLGLEVVLASGEILDMNNALRKNNSGYDLKQIFIGSEGTLGVVTKATLKLAAKPSTLQVSIMAAKTFDNILAVMREANLMGITITAFEFFTDVAHRIVLKHQSNARSPFPQVSPFYVLLEIEQFGQSDLLESFLERLFELQIITDATIATNSNQFKDFWGLRENITESIAAHGHVRKNDISIEIAQLDKFVHKLEELIAANKPQNMEIVLFGHIGDGNLHINYVAPKSQDFTTFQSTARSLEEKIFKLLHEFRGSISAEHGIGLTKKSDLHFTRSEYEVSTMRQIKQIFDPKRILNPGKIFDL